jgi:cytochrome c2
MVRLSMLSAFVALTACATSGRAAEPTSAEVAEAGAKYRKTCRHCHEAPDLRFETERAWLDQVNRTA